MNNTDDTDQLTGLQFFGKIKLSNPITGNIVKNSFENFTFALKLKP